MEKILIAAPTAAVKNYCLEDWLLHLNTLTYPDFTVYLADNTPDGGVNAQYIKDVVAGLELKYPVAVQWMPMVEKVETLAERMAIGHNACRLFAIEYKYRHWLHLETDVFPPENVIEELLSHRKQAVGALYYRDQGISRRLMVQRNFYRSDSNVFADNVTASDDVCIIDGTLKKFAHIGLGCLLMDKTVFEKIPFRSKKGVDASPDSWWAADCFKHGIDIWADTALVCEHRNEAWGLFGVDYK